MGCTSKFPRLLTVGEMQPIVSPAGEMSETGETLKRCGILGQWRLRLL